MRIGYARVSTRDQNLDLQLDALNRAGCERIYQDVASGSKTARPALDELLGQVRAGDVLVIWKLDRMGRSLKHLVELVGNLIERKVGLLSLNDPIDTTSAQGRLVFNLFASLAEFERELIRERTQAGLSAARARGRMGGRPKGLTPRAESARKASGVRDNGNTGISTTKVATLLLTLRIENNSKFVRGKKRTIEHIEHFYLDEYDAQRRSNGEYELKVPYDSDAELDDTVNELLSDIASGADDRHCFSESEVHMEGTDRYW